jgi:hypothetical protein
MSTTINLPTKIERNITTSALNLEPAVKKLKFNPITFGKYCDTIKKDNIKNKLNTIMNRLNDNSHTDIAITKFNSALLEAAGNAGAPNAQRYICNIHKDGFREDPKQLQTHCHIKHFRKIV